MEPLKRHLKTVRRLHDRAIQEGYAGVELPDALARKYPAAPLDWGWQYVSPAPNPSIDPRSGIRRRTTRVSVRRQRRAPNEEGPGR